jgi:hypothetical protein
VTSFSFVKALRHSNPVPLEFFSHISNFLSLSSKQHRITFAVPVIASALCLDSYPPNMYCKTYIVFNSTRLICVQVLIQNLSSVKSTREFLIIFRLNYSSPN